ncbi:MAG: DUF58 domain-containing protein [Candidatus Dormibacteria bacterium]
MIAEEQHLARARRARQPWMRVLRDLQRTTSLTGTGAAGLCVAVVMWGAARLVAGRPLYLLAYGIVGLLGVAWMMGRRKLPLEGSRSDVQPRVREGQSLDIGIALRARRSLSTLVLQEQLPAELGQTVSLPVASLARNQEVEHRYHLTLWRRGAYLVGPMVARYGDPVGLTIHEQVVAEPFEILVHPQYERVSDRPLTRQFEDPPIRPPVSKPWPSGLEFYGMRDFRPGDDLRRVVWRAVARTGRILVREAEQGITDRITIIIDTDQSAYQEEDYSLSFEMGVRAAASLGVRHLREGYQVSVETNGGRLTVPLRGAADQINLLDALARLKTSRVPLCEVLNRLVGNAQRDAHNVLVTSRLSRRDAGQLRLLLNTGVSVLVVALALEAGSEETIHNAAAVGCQVVEVRANVPLSQALAVQVGAGSGRRM